jgi:hypothetical protein
MTPIYLRLFRCYSPFNCTYDYRLAASGGSAWGGVRAVTLWVTI